ncbi:MAG: manganese efflux pump MntP family protein [Phycisphaerae bacterium]
MKIIGLGIGLGMDAMSVSMAVGVKWHGPHQKFRLSWHMGLFQFMMPIIGWLVGSSLAGLLSSVGKYVAAVLVIALGVKMLYEAIREHAGAVAEHAEEEAEELLHIKRKDPTRGLSLILLSIATSIDALVVGFSLGLKGDSIWGASVVIGIVAGVMSLAGVVIGKRAGEKFGKPAEIVGAAVLILLGVSFMVF